MQEQDSNIADWRTNVSDSAPATMKVQDGEVVFGTFLDEGKPNNHADFGESIVFSFKKDDNPEEALNWYVNPVNYALLKQLKELGSLTNLRVKISRKGAKKSDTRYTVEKI